jgi:ketosteroid isomerase-like protein
MTITAATASTPDTTASPGAVVQALYEAFSRGDMGGMLELIDEQVDWSLQVDAPGGELVSMLRNGIGHDAVRFYFSGVANLEFHVFEPQAFHVADEVVLVELRLDLSHRVTGKRAQIAELHRFVVREGKIVHYRPYLDTAAMIELHRP